MLLCFGINRFHLCALIAWQFSVFFAAQMVFPWHCANKSGNASSSTPPSSHEFARDCAMFAACPAGQLHFKQPIAFHSTALQFAWICGADAYKRALYSQTQFGGVLLGTFIFGGFSDAFGRRPVAMFALSFGISSVLASAFATSWHFLLVTRFMVGLSIGGTSVVVCTFVMELILPTQRMVLRAFSNWGIARLALTLICLLFPHWQSASIVCAIVTLPALLFVVFIFPESPMWLHSKNRVEQMRDSERRIAQIAGVPFRELVHREPPEKERTFFDMVHESAALFKRVTILWVMWFTAAICSYSIDLNSAFISGDLYLNQSLLSILIACSKIVLLFFDMYFPRFSRRNLHQWSQMVVVLCFLLLSWLVLVDHQGVGILLINLVGTVFIEFEWDACYLCSMESVPTSLRASSVGSCSLVARVGALFAPLLVFLNSLWAVSVYLAVVLLGTLNLIVSYLWLIETKDINLDSFRLAKMTEDEADDNGREEMKRRKDERTPEEGGGRSINGIGKEKGEGKAVEQS